MRKTFNQLTTLLTVLFIVCGDLRTSAEITLTFDIHGTGSSKNGGNHPQTTSSSDTLDPVTQVGRRNDTETVVPILVNTTRFEADSEVNNTETENVISRSDTVRKAVDSLAPITQNKDENTLKPIVVNERTVNSDIINSIRHDKLSPESVVDITQAANKSLIQTIDVQNILSNISNRVNVKAENINAANESSVRRKPVSFVSITQESVKHEKKDDQNLQVPVAINGTNRPTADVSAEASLEETPISFVSKTNISAPVNQTKDTRDILPVDIGDTRNLNPVAGVNESNSTNVPEEIRQDTLGQGNQIKDASNVPNLTSMIKADVNESISSNGSRKNGSIQADVSFVNSTKPINQTKDKNVISPILTNVTNINDVIDTNNINFQWFVTQATDKDILKPVETGLSPVKVEADNITGIKDSNATVPPPFIIVDDKVQNASDIPSVDLSKRYNSIGTEFCNEKNRCNSTITSRSCYCDVLCGVLGDCCEDVETSTNLNLQSNQFTCRHVNGVNGYGTGLMLVTKCPQVWNDDVTRMLCENEAKNDDIYSRIPVSSQTLEGIIYKNRHCAHCNNVFKYEFWKAEVKCATNSSVIDVSATGNCELFLQNSNTSSKFRTCETNLKLISTCKASFTREDVREKCLNGFYSVTYSNDGDIYRNKYCALCNGVSLRNLYCQSQKFHAIERMTPAFVYSFRMIIDFNSKFEVQNEKITPFHDCNNNEIYDPVSKSCREIFCPPYTEPVRGICDPVSVNIAGVMNNKTMFNTTANCTLTIIKESEFQISNQTNIISFRDINFNATEYWNNGTDIFVCLEKLNLSLTSGTSMFRNIYPFSPVESYISFIGLVLSITGSLLTLIIYIMFPQQLLNIPGKNVMCLIITLAVSQLLFLIASEVATLQNVCVAVAILMHYFFLCSFCWMNVIAFDLWVTFSHKFVSIRHQSLNSRRFYYYSLYAWCLPLLIVGTADILNFIEFGGKSSNSFVPNYGSGVCWITSRNALLLFFAGPLAIFKVFDFICFGFTVYHITKARKQGTFARKGTSTGTFIINLRLSIVMGLTWAFAFLANFTNNTVLWYFFIICNTLQGLFIAISFMCTRKVLKLFREKYDNTFSRSSETQMTTRPSYKSTE